MQTRSKSLQLVPKAQSQRSFETLVAAVGVLKGALVLEAVVPALIVVFVLAAAASPPAARAVNLVGVMPPLHLLLVPVS